MADTHWTLPLMLSCLCFSSFGSSESMIDANLSMGSFLLNERAWLAGELVLSAPA
jgi:hypothetical protein